MREEIILPLIAGKRVLDCGGAEHNAYRERQTADEWLHAALAAHAQEVLGVDVLPAAVDAINREGRYRFLCANAEELPFEQEFDVVVGGELIEHLYNPGRFLLSARRALRPEGLLILTTPNAHSLSQWASIVLRRREQTHPEHVCLFTRQTLTYLVERHGFRDLQLSCLDRPARSRLTGVLRGVLVRLFPALCETLVLVARKAPTVNLYGDKW